MGGRSCAQCATLRYIGHPLSLRLPDATVERLGERARRSDVRPRSLAQRYVEEGLRMDEHPLIRFADGPAGRRARVVSTGLDVWELIAVVLDNDGDTGAAAAYLELPVGLVEGAVGYYSVHPEEIDDWISRNAREAAEGQSAWEAGRAALRR